jgi:hypothetical protein
MFTDKNEPITFIFENSRLLSFIFLKMNIFYAFKSVSTSTTVRKLNNQELIEDCQNKLNVNKQNCHKLVTVLR